MSQRHLAFAGIHPDRLRVAQFAAARCRITVVANGDVAGQGRENVFGKNLRHQAHIGVQFHLVAIGYGDACRFLTAMLQGKNAEKGAARNIHTGRENAEDAAFFVRPVSGMNIIEFVAHGAKFFVRNRVGLQRIIVLMRMHKTASRTTTRLKVLAPQLGYAMKRFGKYFEAQFVGPNAADLNRPHNQVSTSVSLSSPNAATTFILPRLRI